MPYVYSTITNDTNYCEYKKGGADLPVLTKQVLIKGGTGIASKHLVTPLGVVTNVSDEDLDFLKKNEAFKRHMKKGFLKIDDRKVDPEVHASDMTIGDGSSPLVPEDFSHNKDGAKPVDGNGISFKNRILDKFKGE